MDTPGIKQGDSVEWYQMLIGCKDLLEPTLTGTVRHVICHKAGEQYANLYFKQDGILIAVDRDPPFQETLLISGRQIKSYGDRQRGWIPSDTCFVAV